jgi:DNA-binding NarL/FixJ family response regulator
MTNVSIYSASPVAAAGFAAIIGGIEGFRLSGTWSALGPLEEHVRTERPDLLLLELTPAVTLDVIRRLLSAVPAPALILSVGAAPAEFISQILGLGVRGVLGRNSSVEFHTKCFCEVAAGTMWVDPEIGRRLLLTDRIALTPRERQLMGLLAQGLRNKEIAWSMGISEGTVKVYLSRLFTKVGASDRFELALLALRNVVAGGASVPERDRDRSVPFQIPRFVSRERAESVAR